MACTRAYGRGRFLYIKGSGKWVPIVSRNLEVHVPFLGFAIMLIMQDPVYIIPTQTYALGLKSWYVFHDIFMFKSKLAKTKTVFLRICFPKIRFILCYTME